MNFNIFEQNSAGPKKRLLKSQYKGIKYVSTSFNQDTKLKSQGSDYFIGVYEPSKNKCYLLPLSAAYQMHQKVEGFQEKFAPSATD
jgi:A49-like RNA polymerase I associated factor